MEPSIASQVTTNTTTKSTKLLTRVTEHRVRIDVTDAIQLRNALNYMIDRRRGIALSPDKPALVSAIQTRMSESIPNELKIWFEVTVKDAEMAEVLDINETKPHTIGVLAREHVCARCRDLHAQNA